MRVVLAALILVFTIVPASTGLLAQWPALMPPGVPKTADGKPDLNAPAPKAPDGKPDLSGVWETIPTRGGSVFGNIGSGITGGAPYQDWAAEQIGRAHV